MNKIRKQTNTTREKRARTLKDLFESDEFKETLKKARNIPNPNKRAKAFMKIAEEYQLEYEFGTPFLKLVMGEELVESDYLGHDVCRIYDMPDEVLNPNFPEDFTVPIMKNMRLKLEINAYPIHIGISPQTSKRMLIQFINENWEQIADFVNEYYNSPLKPGRIRKKEKRDSFIWDLYSKKGLKATEIEAELVKKHPDEQLTILTSIKSSVE